jgi:hypothetical protein
MADLFQEEETMTATPPTLCARCAQQGKTCCQGREIYITREDRQRIHAFSGTLEFVEWLPVMHPAYLDQDDDPIWQRHVLDRDGRRRILKRKPNEDCLFLGPQGCVLTMAVRPLLCRLPPP